MFPSPGAPAAKAEVRGTGPERHVLLPSLASIPGLLHAFTARGASVPRVLAAAAGRALPIFSLRQVHGAAVIEVSETDAPPSHESRPAGDALIARRRGVALEVGVADCVPILIADSAGGWIGAVHAGWRGAAAGVLSAAIRALVARGARTRDLRVGLGPSIGACCFEVGPEVVQAFERRNPRLTWVKEPGGKARIDLVDANRRQAIEEGVPEEQIEASGLCTVCRPDLLESYRRSGGAPGRMAGLIAWLD
jgi:purine-nucleoside/S-methyl-5'-thioadenosine phosphorylase / adenosine deaminase